MGGNTGAAALAARLTASSLIFALAFAACGSSSSSQAAPAATAKDTLVIAENEPAQTLDPLQAGNSTVDELVLLMYSALVQYRPGESTPSNDLASSVDVSPDGLVYTFKLRTGATFHSGNPVTADDVKYTLDRIKRLNTGVASEIAPLAKSEVIDASTIKLTLSSPFAAFVPALSRIYILDSKLVEANKGSDDGQSWLAINDAGSGPYKLKSYEANVKAEFTRFDGYYGTPAKTANVIYKYIPEQATQRLALEKGDVDIAMDILVADYPALESNYSIVASDTNVQLYGYFNTAKGATADPKVRAAISYAYDYQTHVDSILHGYGTVAQGALPKSMACWTGDQTIPTYDLEKAKSLLADAGYGPGGKQLKLTVTSLTAIEEMDKAAQLLQAGLSQIGVQLDIKSVTFPQFVDLHKTIDSSPDIGLIYAFPSNPDPSAVLYINYHSRFIGNGYNWGNYKNPAVDKALEQAQALTDQSARCDLYAQVQKMIADDYVAINISNPKYVAVMSKYVSGYAYNAAHHQTVNAADISVGQ